MILIETIVLNQHETVDSRIGETPIGFILHVSSIYVQNFSLIVPKFKSTPMPKFLNRQSAGQVRPAKVFTPARVKQTGPQLELIWYLHPQYLIRQDYPIAVYSTDCSVS